ncbi:hypothetical protein ACFL96_17040, partial [Thermoproteota archaeon]
MKTSKFVVVFIVLFMLCITGHASGQKILLKSGKEIEGRVVKKTDEYIKVEIAGVEVSYFIDEIESIEGQDINSYVIEPIGEEDAKTQIPDQYKKGIIVDGESENSVVNKGTIGILRRGSVVRPSQGKQYLRDYEYKESTLKNERAMKLDPSSLNKPK